MTITRACNHLWTYLVSLHTNRWKPIHPMPFYPTYELNSPMRHAPLFHASTKLTRGPQSLKKTVPWQDYSLPSHVACWEYLKNPYTSSTHYLSSFRALPSSYTFTQSIFLTKHHPYKPQVDSIIIWTQGVRIMHLLVIPCWVLDNSRHTHTLFLNPQRVSLVLKLNSYSFYCLLFHEGKQKEHDASSSSESSLALIHVGFEDLGL